MFTGIITAIGTVRAISPVAGTQDMRLRIAAPWPDTGQIATGASIACAGCCLTVVATGQDWFDVDVSGETLRKTNLGGWGCGTYLNLERALRMGDELGGHLVSGHVDGVAEVLSRTAEHGSLCLRIRPPPALARYIAQKGSVALDGVSLTVNDVGADWFEVNVIPHTADATTLGAVQDGGGMHIEIDMLARYVARLHDVENA